MTKESYICDGIYPNKEKIMHFRNKCIEMGHVFPLTMDENPTTARITAVSIQIGPTLPLLNSFHTKSANMILT